MISRVQTEKHVLVGSPPFYMGSEPIGMWLYREYGVPWKSNDVHERLKTVTQEEYEAPQFRTEIDWRGEGTTYRILALALNCL